MKLTAGFLLLVWLCNPARVYTQKAVITCGPGPVISNPAVALLTAGDIPELPAIEDYLQTLLIGPYLIAAVPYNVGPGQFVGTRRGQTIQHHYGGLWPTATITVEDVSAWLDSQHVADATLYIVLLPYGTTVELGTPLHYWTAGNIPYVVLHMGLGSWEAGLSGELLQATTDPVRQTACHSAQPNFNGTYLEAADLCNSAGPAAWDRRMVVHEYLTLTGCTVGGIGP